MVQSRLAKASAAFLDRLLYCQAMRLPVPEADAQAQRVSLCYRHTGRESRIKKREIKNTRHSHPDSAEAKHGDEVKSGVSYFGQPSLVNAMKKKDLQC